MFFRTLFSLSTLTLLVALALSTIAAYYSIIGLTAIFAGAIIPIIVMGSILEIGKIVATVWLRKYWHECGWMLKTYLVSAVVLLAFLTSMGIFGFLSKAHSDQSIVSGDVLAKLAIIDEKIKTQRENIDTARRALAQLDAQVNERLSRGNTEQGVERAAVLRRQQTQERNKLLKDVADAQAVIQKLNEERAPIAAENRKVEAEVGPIKYIAALIYGETTDNNLLESAVRWVIILLVIVFDPLAIALVLAANSSREWEKKKYLQSLEKSQTPTSIPDPVVTTEEIQQEDLKKNSITNEDVFDIKKHPYLFKGGFHNKPNDWKHAGHQVYIPKVEVNEKVNEEVKELIIEPEITQGTKEIEKVEVLKEPKIIKTENVTIDNSITDLQDGYVLYDGKRFSKAALKEIQPQLFVQADNGSQVKTNFGIHFPSFAAKGDIFVRVDILPNKVFKFDGKRWIEINKNVTDSYLYDVKYIKFLVDKISSGEYDIELLTENERNQIEEYLKTSNG